MANQTIPITLTWGPVGQAIVATTIDELGELIARQLAGEIRADVTFILVVLTDPTTLVTELIYNQTQRVLKAWNTTTGRYEALTEFQSGDIKYSVSGADQIPFGWVVANGRAISSVFGLSPTQISNLEALFGSGGNLPTIVPVNGVDLPPPDSFSGIADVTVAPDKATIDALAVGATYTQAEIEAIRDAAGDLSDSTNNVETQVKAIRDKCDEFLTAVRQNNNPALYALVFAGYP